MSFLSKWLAAPLLWLPVMAVAGPVTVQVIGSDGRPLVGAVVSVEVPGAPAAVARGSYVMGQRNIRFDPHVLVVPVGATVSFPNFDRVRHHVYSFSAAKRFDLRLDGRDDSRSVVFDRAGVVAVGCNIHDSMSGFVYVTATPFAAVTDTAGRATIANVPAGNATLRLWHPSVRAAGNSLAQPAAIASGGYSTTLTIRH